MAKRKAGNPGATASNAAASYWHPLACRVYLHLLLTQPSLKGDARLEKIVRHLHSIGVRVRGGSALSIESVRFAINAQKRKGGFDEIRQSYLSRPGDLLAFDRNSEKAAAIELETDSDGTQALAAAWFMKKPLSREQREHAYRRIFTRAPLELRALLDRYALEWIALQRASELAGAKSADFPATEILARAFPDLSPQTTRRGGKV